MVVVEDVMNDIYEVFKKHNISYGVYVEDMDDSKSMEYPTLKFCTKHVQIDFTIRDWFKE